MKTIKERFSDKVKVTNDCHEWTGCIARNGYGQIRAEGKAQYAHRVAYKLYVGEIRDKECVCHTCDNRRCVNPDHLFLGSHKDNTADAIGKLRHPHGDTHGKSKLTSKQVLEIRKLKGTQKEISEKFNVSMSLIGFIQNRKIWKHI